MREKDKLVERGETETAEKNGFCWQETIWFDRRDLKFGRGGNLQDKKREKQKGKGYKNTLAKKSSGERRNTERGWGDNRVISVS